MQPPCANYCNKNANNILTFLKTNTNVSKLDWPNLWVVFSEKSGGDFGMDDLIQLFNDGSLHNLEFRDELDCTSSHCSTLKLDDPGHGSTSS
mmetsp:Transcript_15751/g.19203  ORF Transcript_15751/g.19203 Transcript_15751/m.19203 type:complete len:92 (+) Transcript_15751:780-1055(+)